MYTLKCQICGKEFVATFKDMTTCEDCKRRPCEVCGKPFVHPWPYTQRCCSKECRSVLKKDPKVVTQAAEKRENTVKQRYGVDNVAQLDSVKEKISTQMRSAEHKEKVRQTSLEKYGVEHYQNSENIKEKRRNTVLSNKLDKLTEITAGGVTMTHEEIMKRVYSLDDFDYEGVEAPIGVKVCALCGKEFKPFGRNRSRQRFCKRTHFLDCIVCGKPIEMAVPSDKYGAVRYTCSKECETKLKVQKAQDTMEQRYGARNPSQIKEFHDKAVESIKAKIPETNEKARATLEAKYGGIGAGSPILRKKIESTMLERYGNINPAKNDEIRAKISEMCRSEEYQQKYAETALKNWGTDRPSRHPEVIAKMREAWKGRNNTISLTNQHVAEVLFDSYGVETDFEFPIERKRYDLIVKGTNILLEIDPTFTHSNLPTERNEGKASDYHLKKTQLASENGYRCIHMFDWDKIDKIAHLLQPTEPIYARKCVAKKVSKQDANVFLEKYHLQGKTKTHDYAYGLFYENQLVSVMTFGKPRYNNHYEWELLRLCTQYGKSVIGGPAKLFSQFINEVNPSSVLSYCDLAKFTGDVYEKIGFRLHHTSPPAKIWSKDTKYYTDNYLRAQGADRILGTNYGKGTSNELIMVEHGYRSVYDCGQLVYEWIRPTC